ncbi:MAG TPA: carboxylate-amine ligase [Hellea balneolensis]|uniref:Putative glutamate--cysteine ligase 2 n=1 Tax=Hellea balneolensis TaxID=287478 RepID=A0A7C3C516_9PROT|nr:carboxylate-amine ligase [Hellea balneolensis]
MKDFWPTLGVEEEYLVVDPHTREAASDPHPGFFKECKKEIGDSVTPEFLRCQIEIATPVCQNLTEVREHLVNMRGTIAHIAQKYDLRLMAASTHPFTSWRAQKPTEAERYTKMDKDLQGAIRRMLICGTHVHVGILDAGLRIDIMNQMRYFLPHMLALSTSSPFWEGEIMGMKSYRLSVFDGMPRTGIPDVMVSIGEYEKLVGTLIKAGVIEDATKIWWDLRPSVRFPTLETRVADMCTRFEDTLAITALYQCLTRMMVELKQRNIKWRTYPSLLIAENRWMAQRFGVAGNLIDFGKGGCTPFKDLIEEMIGFLLQHAQALGCERELLHARTIVERGSSACRQIRVYEENIADGKSKDDALKAVVDDLIEGTMEGVR